MPCLPCLSARLICSKNSVSYHFCLQATRKNLRMLILEMSMTMKLISVGISPILHMKGDKGVIDGHILELISTETWRNWRMSSFHKSIIGSTTGLENCIIFLLFQDKGMYYILWLWHFICCSLGLMLSHWMRDIMENSLAENFVNQFLITCLTNGILKATQCWCWATFRGTRQGRVPTKWALVTNNLINQVS